MWNEAAVAFVFHAAPQQTHCLRIGEELERGEEALEVSRIHEHDGGCPSLHHYDRMFRVTHRAVDQLRRAIAQLNGGD